MPTDILRTQSPRKKPSQSRSTVTVEAVIEATLQVLEREGYARLTTTRVAERAGVSIGSVYQYFPNRRALIAELVRRHLSSVTQALAKAVAEHRNASLERLVEALVTAFVAAKRDGIARSRLLHPALSDIDTAAVVSEATQHANRLLAALLRQRPEFAGRADVDTIAEVLSLALAAPVSAWVLQSPERLQDPACLDHLRALALGYLERQR